MSSEDFIQSFYNLSALSDVTVNKTCIKINMVLVGDDNTGKRSFMHAAVRGRLPEYLGSCEPPPPFVAVDFLGQKVLLQLIFWNVHGEMKREPFYILNRQTPIGFIFFNISQPSTFETAKNLIKEMKIFMSGSSLFLIGTFGDLRNDLHHECVPQSTILELVSAEQLSGYFETSVIHDPKSIEKVLRQCAQIFAESEFGRRFIINNLKDIEPATAEYLAKIQKKALKQMCSPSPSMKRRKSQEKDTKVKKKQKIKHKKESEEDTFLNKAKENGTPNVLPQSHEQGTHQESDQQKTQNTPKLRRMNARYPLIVQNGQHNIFEVTNQSQELPLLPPPPTLKMSLSNSAALNIQATEIILKPSSETTSTIQNSRNVGPDRCSLVPVPHCQQQMPLAFESVAIFDFSSEFTEIPFDELHFDNSGRPIGRGTFSDVYKGQWRGRLVAIKKFKQIINQPSAQTTTEDKEIVTMFRSEIAILQKLKHPNIVLCYGGCTSPALCIVCEYMKDGSLGDVLFKQKRQLSESEVFCYARDVAAAMAYLHSLEPKIVHRDLKADNILLDGTTAKITDFGLSRSKSMTTMVLNTSVGTGRYMAPELLTVGGYTEKIDVWAYGIILYEMVTGIAPFLNLNYAGLYRELIEKRELPSIPSTCPRVLREIIRKCWSFDPVRRPSFAEIYQTLQRELANTK